METLAAIVGATTIVAFVLWLLWGLSLDGSWDSPSPPAVAHKVKARRLSHPVAKSF